MSEKKKNVPGFCRICGKLCEYDYEVIRTKRKEINFFHKDCIRKELQELAEKEDKTYD